MKEVSLNVALLLIVIVSISAFILWLIWSQNLGDILPNFICFPFHIPSHNDSSGDHENAKIDLLEPHEVCKNKYSGHRRKFEYAVYSVSLLFRHSIITGSNSCTVTFPQHKPSPTSILSVSIPPRVPSLYNSTDIFLRRNTNATKSAVEHV